MDQPLHYDIRDILIAPARALSAKRIFVMTLFLCAGLAVYTAFTYLATLLAGDSVEALWRLYGLLPLRSFVFDSSGAQVAYGVGIVLGILSLMFGMLAVSAIEIEQIRGNRFFSIRGGIRFALSRAGQVVVSMIAIIAFLLFILLLFLLFGLVVRIPVVGEWLYVLTFVVPGFIIAIFTVFIFAVLQVGVVLLPATAAAERHGEAFTTILETFSTVIRQPVRWLVYTAYGLVAGKVCSWVFAYFCYRAVQFIAWGTSLSAGEKTIDLVRSGLGHLPVRSDVVDATLQVFPGIDLSFSIAQWTGYGDSAASHAMGLMLFLVFASIIGYFLSVVATTQARGYVLIRYFKDEYRVTEEKPMFLDDVRDSKLRADAKADSR